MVKQVGQFLPYDLDYQEIREIVQVGVVLL